MEIGRLHFVWPQLSLSRQSRGFAIVADPPRINWSPVQGMCFTLTLYYPAKAKPFIMHIESCARSDYLFNQPLLPEFKV